jgi:hypothetical protein
MLSKPGRLRIVWPSGRRLAGPLSVGVQATQSTAALSINFDTAMMT